MISYRALKKLVGETSLERKCRFLFGAALLLLITGSFWFYASRTTLLVENQQLAAARALIPRLLQLRHQRLLLTTPAEEEQPTASGLEGDGPPAGMLKTPGPAAPRESIESPGDRARSNLLKLFDLSLQDISEYNPNVEWQLIDLRSETPGDIDAFEALDAIRSGSDVSEQWFFREDDTNERYLHYYGAIRAAESCCRCHNGPNLSVSAGPIDTTPPTPVSPLRQITDVTDSSGGSTPNVVTANANQGELMSLAALRIPMASVESQLIRNKAILLASAIFTSFLAMLAAYAIVRYIIVKPVLHLKDVSDEIARGNLTQRAEISTGDEFEELSHAFNRMLRHMMTVNRELQELADDNRSQVDELARANMELFTSNRLKDDFLATMSHELRTPLNSILGFSDVLAEAPNLDERQQRYVHNIRTSGNNLMLQINDLLDLAKIESGKMELQAVDVRLEDVIRHQVQQIAPLADRKHLDLRVEESPTPIPAMNQDAGKLHQILNNLLSNAVKFTPEGGRIRVTYSCPTENEAEFCVADTGVGIPLDEQELIFEKFRQGGRPNDQERDLTKREYEGTGLGLSIVRELSRLLGGDVFLDSEFGKGSTFYVRIPLEVPQEDDLEPVLMGTPVPAGNGRITSVNLMGEDPVLSEFNDPRGIPARSDDDPVPPVDDPRSDKKTE